MQATAAYAAKRALFDRLASLTGAGYPLEGVQVSYEYPARDLARKVVYGGGVRFTQTQSAAEWGELAAETVTVGVYVRVLRVDNVDVRTADTDVEAIVAVFSDALTGDPQLAGGLTFTGVVSGTGDYARPSDGTESVLALQVQIDAVLA